MMRTLKLWAGSFVAVCALAGCSGVLSGIKHDTGADTSRADALLGGLGAGSNRNHLNDGVVANEGFWLSGTAIKVAHVETLPPLFSQPASFDRSVASLQEFAERVTRLTGVPARVSASASAAALRATSFDGLGARTTGQGGATPPLPPGMLTGGAGARTSSSAMLAAAGGTVHLSYRGGDLKGLLDTASARFGVYWKFVDGNILFYFTDTKVFQVSSVPGDAKINASVMSSASSQSQSGGLGGAQGSSGAGSTGGSGSGTSTPSLSASNVANTDMSAQLSVFDGLQSSIKSMLSPYGTVVPSPATGSIAVTDTPDVLERVSTFMTQQNRLLSRQILVDVQVLTVTLTKSDNYGINWGVVYQALGTKFGITNTFPTAALNPIAFSASVITPSSRASGTSAMISALSEQGTVRRKTSASVTTLNDQPVPVQVATEQGYLAQVSTTTTANVGSQTSLTPGTVTTGFNLTLLPHVLDDGTVMMQFYTNLSVLDALQTVSSGGQQIEVPQVETRNFLQRVAIKSGQTLVLSGYEGLSDNGDQQGVGVASNPVLGGGFNASRSREVIVILLTPVLMAGV